MKAKEQKFGMNINHPDDVRKVLLTIDFDSADEAQLEELFDKIPSLPMKKKTVKRILKNVASTTKPAKNKLYARISSMIHRKPRVAAAFAGTEMNRERFLECYEAYNRKLSDYIYSMIPDSGTVQEILVDTWSRLWTMWQAGKLENVKNPYAYIIGISRISMREHFQERARRLNKYHYGLFPNIKKPGLNTDEKVISTLLLSDIIRYINEQKKPLPEIFRLYFLQGLNSAKISEMLEMPRATVRAHICRIRQIISNRFNYR